MSWRASVVGRFAQEAAARGEGEVRAVFRRSFYLRFAGERTACVGDPSLGRGPLNALVDDWRLPAIGERVALSVDGAQVWTPPPLPPQPVPDVSALKHAARGRVPREGFGGLVVDAHNSLSGHAQPALEAIERWLVGNALDDDAEMLIGLGPGLTPSGDDYLGGVLIALHQLGRETQARGLWRWLAPRLARTSAISAAHLAAAAAGEGHEALHAALAALCTPGADWPGALDALDDVGHCSGWDSLAGVAAVAKIS
jgi:Protein of unknown function (DUF2877)